VLQDKNVLNALYSTGEEKLLAFVTCDSDVEVMALNLNIIYKQEKRRKVKKE